MPRLNPVKCRNLGQRLNSLGFEGPYRAGKHPYMVRGDLVLTIPSPHREDVGAALLSRILPQAGISREQWDATR